MDMQSLDERMPVLESRLVFRRWIESDRVVILSRSILDDHIYPHGAGNLVENRTTWSVISAKGPSDCYLSVYVNMSMPIFPEGLSNAQPATGTLTDLMLQLSNKYSQRFGDRVQKAIFAHKGRATAEAVAALRPGPTV
ncbi:hypothetical protein ACHHYP_02131 [Achlya hypogyna]|uniref:START domain-containing protein n=1 Tax=Achlya hypogyna TaxID=1202772 RepID=A0A1V9Z7G7_ACHHY|nr:hypothetical protein ACHHYP_02131 [Achlya hypogyna]